MIVRCKNRLAPDCIVQMLAHRPGDRYSIISRSTSPNLIQEHQASPRRGVKNAACLRHLHHEGRLAANQVVTRPNPSEKAIDNADARLGFWHEAASLCHQHNLTDLPEHCRLP